jgi:hypothetical protein
MSYSVCVFRDVLKIEINLVPFSSIFSSIVFIRSWTEVPLIIHYHIFCSQLFRKSLLLHFAVFPCSHLVTLFTGMVVTLLVTCALSWMV